MASPSFHISVCVCTFRRPILLKKLLDAIPVLQRGTVPFTVSCVVVDNDVAGSAEAVVRDARSTGLAVEYAVVPERNIANVRNQAVFLAKGDYIAFIDDDEVPRPEWLAQLLDLQVTTGAAGVLGPVRPYFDITPPRWLVKSKLCDRPVHPTGLELRWNQTRTGNVLLRAELFREDGLRFDSSYGTGGEDVDFFRRAMAGGHKFVWCEEAPVYELVPVDRSRASYHLKRALLQGGISLSYAAGGLSPGKKLRILAKSLPALALYTVSIPFLLLIGFHHAIRVLVKWCHHFGRLSALLGLKLIRERNL